MSGLWRNNPETPEGKFLVKRRDGSIPEYPVFVIGAKDPCAPAALIGYAEEARKLEMDKELVEDVLYLSLQYEHYREDAGAGRPDAPPHRQDDPDTIKEMQNGTSA